MYKDEKNNVIREKTLDFSVRIAHLSKHVRRTQYDSVLTKQILRSGTNIGANVAESQGAQSKADFITKMHIALKECYETNHWLDLFNRLEYLNEREYNSIKADAEELIRLLTKIINTAKKNKK